MVYQLVYVSSAAQAFSDEELMALLAQARETNRELNVTGMLLYKGGNFMQVLEGDREVVEALKVRIFKDRRHHGAIVLMTREKDERSFAEWTMGFYNLNNPEAKSIEGYIDFMNSDLTDQRFVKNPDDCFMLLESFRESMKYAKGR